MSETPQPLPEKIDWIATPDALAGWIERQSTRLQAIVQQKAGTALRARISEEDLLQDAFVRASFSIESTPIREVDIMGWFMQVISNTVIDAHRHHFGTQKRNARREVPLNVSPKQGLSLADVLAGSLTSPSQAFSRLVRIDRLHQAIMSLPDDARNAIEWKYMQNAAIDEIAERLGRTNAAVRSLLFRTIETLAVELEDVRPSIK